MLKMRLIAAIFFVATQFSLGWASDTHDCVINVFNQDRQVIGQSTNRFKIINANVVSSSNITANIQSEHITKYAGGASSDTMKLKLGRAQLWGNTSEVKYFINTNTDEYFSKIGIADKNAIRTILSISSVSSAKDTKLEVNLVVLYGATNNYLSSFIRVLNQSEKVLEEKCQNYNYSAN